MVVCPILEELYADPEERTRWSKVYSLISKQGKVKDLHKKPAMTTGYGKAAGGHSGTIRELLEGDSQMTGLIFEILGRDRNSGEAFNQVLKEMTKIEEMALKEFSWD